MALAAAEATKYIGATSPNPPVGACVVKDDRIFSLGAHAKAGLAHAERIAIETAEHVHGKDALRGATLYVTLEPCNHQGRTPPCTDLIVKAGIARVVYADRDPNPHVQGKGHEFLQERGIKVERLYLDFGHPATILNAPFQKWVQHKTPWIVHKRAYRIQESANCILNEGQMSMIPDPGSKTFTSQQSLELAHEERKKSDAIITGLSTVQKDYPLFTVRHLADHPEKKRILAVLSRQINPALPAGWKERQEKLGFEVLCFQDPKQALLDLGAMGVQRALLEAGPTLSLYFENSSVWDERLTIIHAKGLTDQPDLVYREFQREEYKSCSPESSQRLEK